jgi:hypothetical protein
VFSRPAASISPGQWFFFFFLGLETGLYYIAQVGLELAFLLSVTHVLGLHACTTTPDLFVHFLKMEILRSHFTPTELETLEVGPRYLHYSKVNLRTLVISVLV